MTVLSGARGIVGKLAVTGVIAAIGAVGLAGPAMAAPARPSGAPAPRIGSDGGGVLPPPPTPAQLQQDKQRIVADATAAGPSVSLAAVPDLTPPDPTQPQAQDAQDYGVPDSASEFASGDGYTIGAPQPGGTSAGVVPAGLESYYSQKVAWGDCAPFDPADFETGDGFECAYIIAPLDYSNPTGPTIALAVAKSPAKGAEKKGSIFADPGGPGGTGLWMAQDSTFETLNQNFDIIGLDPRGVGSSLPMIRCQSNADWDAQRQGSDLLDSAQLNSILERNTDDCYQWTGAPFGIQGEDFIKTVGTVNVVKDLDLERSVLGDDKLNYVGFSYGTSIGYEYARQFPDNIRSMIIDGVVNPLSNNPDELAKYSQYSVSQGLTDDLAQMQGFEATFEQFLSFCAANDNTAALSADGATATPCALGNSGDIPTMMAAYHAISQGAWGGASYVAPARNGNPARPLSFNDLSQGTIEAMYTDQYWGYLNQGLLDLKSDPNNGRWMMALSDAYASRNSDGTYGLLLAAFPTISCTDDGTAPGTNDPATLLAARQQLYSIAPFMDPGTDPTSGAQRGLQTTNDWCTYYQDQFTLPKGQTLQAMPNVLVISTTYDPATPYDSGVVAAAAMGATLLTVAGAGHTSMGSSECANQIASAYIDTLVVPTDVTGGTGVQTKDVHSNVITGNECTVDTEFRPVPTIPQVSGVTGGTVTLTATGLVRNTAYAIGSPFAAAPTGTGLRAAAGAFAAAPPAPLSVTADATGTLQVVLAVPADAAPGSYQVTLDPADPLANDPTVHAVGTVLIDAAPTTAPTSPPPAGPTSSAPVVVPVPGGQAPGPQLAATGAPAAGLVAAALSLLLLGGALVLVSRRRGAGSH